MRSNTKNPVNPVSSTHKVLISSAEKWSHKEQHKIKIKFVTMVNPPGRALLKIFSKNRP